MTASFYRSLVRPILFRLDAERVHHFTVEACRVAGALPLIPRLFDACLSYQQPALPIEVAGIPLKNPIGLAAGWDKSGRALAMLRHLGFGFVEIGSVSARPSKGNPRPRLFRLPQDRAIIVNYGLPNDGAEVVQRRLAQYGRLAQYDGLVPCGVNLVKTNDGPNSPDCDADAIYQDYLASVTALHGNAGYLALNLSCPNARGGKEFFAEHGTIGRLLDHLASVPIRCPVFLKVSPDPSPAAIERLIQETDGFDFVKGFVFNLPPGKPKTIPLETPREIYERMPGAIAGRPTMLLLNQCISEMYRRMPVDRYAIIGGGGVFSAEDAYEKIRLGASLVQIYTALIYEGPAVVKRLNQGLAELLERDGFSTVQAAVGTAQAARSIR